MWIYLQNLSLNQDDLNNCCDILQNYAHSSELVGLLSIMLVIGVDKKLSKNSV